MDMKLELSEGAVYGEQYWTVMPLFPAHAPTWFKTEWDEMLTWCVSTFGPTPEDGVWTPAARWYVNSAKFWFKDAADRDWFVLRWS